MWTVISRLDWLRIFQRPSSRLSLWAANSNRAACASQGLVSCEITVVMPSPNFVQHHLAGPVERNTCAARYRSVESWMECRTLFACTVSCVSVAERTRWAAAGEVCTPNLAEQTQ